MPGPVAVLGVLPVPRTKGRRPVVPVAHPSKPVSNPLVKVATCTVAVGLGVAVGVLVGKG